MNAPISRADLEAYAVHSADLMASLVTKEAEPKRRGPWNHSDEGRKRRQDRRAAIRAKMAWMDD